MSDLVQVHIENGVAELKLCRAEKLNALDQDMLEAIDEAFSSLKDVRAAFLHGDGKAFVAGADIAAMKDLSGEEAERFSLYGQEVFAKLENADFPVIAAVNGFALGGGLELAMACDFIYASEKAKFGQPEVKHGVIPGFGGTQRLTRRVGIAKAKELIFTGKMLRADEALRIGLANALFSPDTLIEETRKTCQEISKMGPLALKYAKETMNFGADRLLTEANNHEANFFGKCFLSDDQKEGMDAFLNKREATFTGK